MAGTLLLDSPSGIDDVVGLDSASTGAYTLIAAAGDFSNIEHFGLANAFDFGGSKSTYFQNGSLELIVIPESGTDALRAVVICCRR